jgi:hypothetical protein
MKAKLTREQLVAALLAGLFGHVLIAIGWWSFGMLLVAALLVLVIGTLLSLLLGGTNPIELLGDGASDLGGVLVIVVILAVLVGAGVLFAGIMVSRGILRRGHVRRPVAVTIRAALIAVAIDTVLFVIAASNAATTSDADRVGPFIGSGVLLLVGALIIGPLVWLWMTHAHRGPAADAIQPSPAGPPAVTSAPAEQAMPGYSPAPPAEPSSPPAPPASSPPAPLPPS